MSKLVTMKFVKIGIFDPYLDTLGGGEKYMLTVASCLSKSNQVFVFWEDESIFNKAHDRFGIDLRNAKITRNIFSKEFSLPQRLIESNKYDAIFYLSDGSLPFVISKKLFVHFQFPVQWVSGGSIMAKFKLARINKIICNSEFTKKFIDEKFHVSSMVIYPPSSGEYEVKKIKKQNIILSVGRFNLTSNDSTFKKHESLIEFFKKMVDHGLKEWKLVLVTSIKNADLEKLGFIRNMIGKYPIELKLNVEANDLASDYARASIYWHAAGYGEDINAHPEKTEHFGIATVQAMESGAVPVVFGQGGQIEIITDGRNGFLWQTEKECLEKTWSLVKSKGLMTEISLEAKKRAKDFSIDRFCDDINSVFK